MKRYINLIVFIACICVSSCKEYDTNYPEGYVGSSKVTSYPILTLNGDRYVALVNGGTFTDPGATATEGGQDVPVTVSGTVDPSKPGVYTLTYTAVNSDGFSASINRTVVVATVDASAINNDFSGRYARSTNASVAVWTKIAPGVYTVFNPGGAPGTNLTVVAWNTTGFNVEIPPQAASDGSPTSSADETSNMNATPANYTWVIVNPGYGTAPRTFTKI
ncbi:DUF5011 domain-containing protein [Solitalea lacus]|uniref:DUF5011 domain-containing protein n=1 Tax=Solitalea lacus TaxID=2911172 RepID=UPI001EDC6553|nr:DUF5011 domain-containing protein [Solitalea lacus]UKJ07687.1 DUF5011 domain-containing protein [Solitalea lacus]